MEIKKGLALWAAAGAGLTAVCFVAVEGYQGFDPADLRSKQVKDCAPYVPDTAEFSSVIPEPCKKSFGDDFRSKGYGYDLPAHDTFVGEYTPGPDYNIAKAKEYAMYSLIFGGLATAIGSLVFVVDAMDKKPEGQPKTIQEAPVPKPSSPSKFAGKMVIPVKKRNKRDNYDGELIDPITEGLRTRRKNMPGYLGSLPLDTIGNEQIIHDWSQHLKSKPTA